MLCKVKNPKLFMINIVAIGALIASFCSHYDNDHTYKAPIWIIAIPFCIMLNNWCLMAVINCFYEEDECTRIFNGYDTRMKKFMVCLNSVFTFLYSISLVTSLYLYGQAQTNK